MKKVAILAYDGCWAMNLFAVTDFFRVVALLEQHLGLAPGYAVEVLSGDGAEVRAASGHRVQADGAIDAAQCYELVVIPAIEGVRLGAGFSPDAIEAKPHWNKASLDKPFFSRISRRRLSAST